MILLVNKSDCIKLIDFADDSVFEHGRKLLN